MTADKLKQWIGLIGGFLGALYLALKSAGIEAEWLAADKVNPWLNVMTTLIPFVLAGYGIYKNQYLLTHRAKKQEETLKQKGLK
ncbi:phage holin [Macrococcus equipercicus]|uniref:PTS mannose transporter subunit IID n=1 Tax=Macrococcus equipercicus TaxID=69967 RepID=A0A9Q9F1E3_9STAP|nr:phage holin [Macrococcus equipercicus]UTH13286.1 PTS mannose transporter subunit IID [Macrococcus equipercicus]